MATTKVKSRAAFRVRGEPRPMTAKDLARFRKLVGTDLPPSWCAFMARHGPGQLAGYANLRGMARRPSSAMTLAELFALYRDDLDTYVDQYARGRRAEKARLARLVPFGDTIGGDVIAWDPGAEPAEETTSEYPVVLLPSGGAKVVDLAPGFDAFVEVLFASAFGKLLGDPDWKAERVFVPA